LIFLTPTDQAKYNSEKKQINVETPETNNQHRQMCIELKLYLVPGNIWDSVLHLVSLC